jgi:predicted RNA-binding protein with PIN domain
MSRLIIVDGYNLILRSPLLQPGSGRTLREARQKLVNLLSWVVGSGEARFIVVFDGSDDRAAADDSHGGRVEVRYSRPPRKADDVIRALVEEHMDRAERLTVVTSDLEVARHARAMGAEIALADLFLSSIVPPESGASVTPEKPSTLSRRELEEWADLFRNRPPEDDPDATS